MAERLFPNDTMRAPRRGVRGPWVGAPTAWRIGWAPEKEWVQGFRPDEGQSVKRSRRLRGLTHDR